MRTYINLGMGDYLSSRYHSQHSLRAMIMPFVVPESFAQHGKDAPHFGSELAKKLQHELLRTGELQIIEFYNQENWPGKKEEFFAGNYHALELARNAGFDLLVVGYMHDIVDDETISIHTKIIDTSNYVTIWSARTFVYTQARTARRFLGATRLYGDRPELFAFGAQADKFAHCTVERILNAELVPE